MRLTITPKRSIIITAGREQTKLDEKRRNIYEVERRGVQQKTSQLFRRYNPSDCGYKQWMQQKSSIRNDGHNDQLGVERGGSGRKTQGTLGSLTQVGEVKGYVGLMPIVDTFTDISGRKRKVLRLYTDEIQMKLIARGDCFYDITKIKDITNSAAGQALIKAAGSVSNISKSIIPNSDRKVNTFGKKSGGRSATKGQNGVDASNKKRYNGSINNLENVG